MKKIIVHLFIAVGLALASAGAQADRLVFKGSDTLGAKLVPKLISPLALPVK